MILSVLAVLSVAVGSIAAVDPAPVAGVVAPPMVNAPPMQPVVGQERAIIPNRPVVKAAEQGKFSQWPSQLKVFTKPDEFYFAADALSNKKESGFLVELLAIIQQRTGTVFNIESHPELMCGRPNANGTYDGTVIAPLLNNEADIVGPSLTINSWGYKVVDYCVPILPYKLEIVFNP